MELLTTIFSTAGIQWAGWALAFLLVIRIMMLSASITQIVERNTAAITELTTIIRERLPNRGS